MSNPSIRLYNDDHIWLKDVEDVATLNAVHEKFIEFSGAKPDPDYPYTDLYSEESLHLSELRIVNAQICRVAYVPERRGRRLRLCEVMTMSPDKSIIRVGHEVNILQGNHGKKRTHPRFCVLSLDIDSLHAYARLRRLDDPSREESFVNADLLVHAPPRRLTCEYRRPDPKPWPGRNALQREYGRGAAEARESADPREPS